MRAGGMEATRQPGPCDEWHTAAQNDASHSNNGWNSAIFMVCSKRVRLIKASTLMIQVDANSFGLPIIPTVFTPDALSAKNFWICPGSRQALNYANTPWLSLLF